MSISCMSIPRSVGCKNFRLSPSLAGRVVDPGPKTSMFTPPHHDYTDLLLSSVPEIDPNWLDELLEKRAAKGKFNVSAGN